MKKTFIIMAMAAIIASCGSNETKPAGTSADSTSTTATPANPESTTPEATAPAAPVDVSANPDYKKGLALIAKSDCLSCHNIEGKLVGPSYTEVAQRYAGKPGIEDTLANKIVKGGAGNWGDVPMMAHPTLAHEDAVAMAKYILLLKK